MNTYYGDNYNYTEVEGMKPLSCGNFEVTISADDKVITIEEDGSLLAHLAFSVNGNNLLLQGKDGEDVTSVELPFAMTEVSGIEYVKETQEIILIVKDAEGNEIPFSVDVAELAMAYKAGNGLTEEVDENANLTKFHINIKEDEKFLKVDEDGLYTDLDVLATDEDVAELKEKVEAVEEKIGDLEDKVGEDIASAIAGVKEDIEDVKEMIGDLEDKVGDDIASAIESIKEDIDAIEEKMGDLEEELGDNLADAISSINEDVEGLKEMIGDLEEKVGEDIASAIADVKEDIEDAKENIENLGEELDAVKETVSNLSDDLDSVKENIESLEEKTDNLDGKIDAEIERATSAETALNDTIINMNNGIQDKFAHVEEELGKVDDKIDEKIDEFGLTVKLEPKEAHNNEHASCYVLKVNDKEQGEIHILKDQFLEKTEYNSETKVLTFFFSTKDGSIEERPINISDLVDTYLPGAGLTANTVVSHMFDINTNGSKFIAVTGGNVLDSTISFVHVDGDQTFKYNVIGNGEVRGTIDFSHDINDLKVDLDNNLAAEKAERIAADEAIVGTTSDSADDMTLYGVKKFAKDYSTAVGNNRLADAKAYTDAQISSLSGSVDTLVASTKDELQNALTKAENKHNEDVETINNNVDYVSGVTKTNTQDIFKLSEVLGYIDSASDYKYNAQRGNGIVDKLYLGYHELIARLDENNLNEFLYNLVEKVNTLENKINIIMSQDETTVGSIKAEVAAAKNGLITNYTNAIATVKSEILDLADKAYQPKGAYVTGSSENYVTQSELQQKAIEIGNEISNRDYATKSYVNTEDEKVKTYVDSNYANKEAVNAIHTTFLTKSDASTIYTSKNDFNSHVLNCGQEMTTLRASITNNSIRIDAINNLANSALTNSISATGTAALLDQRVIYLEGKLINGSIITKENLATEIANIAYSKEEVNEKLTKYLTLETARDTYQPKIEIQELD